MTTFDVPVRLDRDLLRTPDIAPKDHEIPRLLPGEVTRAVGYIVESDVFTHRSDFNRDLLRTPDIAPRKDSLQLVPAQVVVPGANIDAAMAPEQRLPGFTEHAGEADWNDVAAKMDAVCSRMDAVVRRMDAADPYKEAVAKIRSQLKEPNLSKQKKDELEKKLMGLLIRGHTAISSRMDEWSDEAREAAVKERGKGTKTREEYLRRGSPPASLSERLRAWDKSRDLRPNVTEEERQAARKLASTGYK